MVTAIILIEAELPRVSSAAEALAGIPEVSEVYSVAGPWDLVAVVRVAQHEDLARVVTEEVARVEGVKRTQTLIAFRAYSRHDLERLFSLGFEGAEE